jgi:hypothetical protein
MDPNGALKTAVLLVLFTRLMSDAMDRTARHSPVPTMAVCELAMALHANEPAARSVPMTIAVPSGADSAAAQVLLVLAWIRAALNAQAYAAHAPLFMELFARVVLENVPYASTALIDDSEGIPPGIRALLASIIGGARACATEEARTEMRARIDGAQSFLRGTLNAEERAKLSAVEANLKQSVPLLAVVVDRAREE